MNHLKTPVAPIAAAVALALGAGLIGYHDDANAQSRTPARHAAPAVKAPPPAQLNQQFIIRYHADADVQRSQRASRDLLQAAGASVGVQATHRRFMTGGNEVIAVNRHLAGAELKTFMQSISADRRVSEVLVDAMVQPTDVPDDPRWAEQVWHYGDGPGGIDALGAWEFSTGEGVVVAVIDTGYRPHEDLAANLISNGYDFIADPFISRKPEGRSADAIDVGDWRAAGECGPTVGAANSSWHGTHVAGTVAAVTNNGIGVAGAAYDAQILPVRALGRCGGFTSDVAEAIIWAAGGAIDGVPENANPAQVINLSLGSGQPCPSVTQDAVNLATSLGATVVVSAGNAGGPAANASPASCENVVTVASNGPTGALSGFSNRGPEVDIAAPGGSGFLPLTDNVLSLVDTGTEGPVADGYGVKTGTSMSAPHVAAAAAIAISIDDTLTPQQVRDLLVDTSYTGTLPTGCNESTVWCGAGIVDARFAAAVASGVEDAPPPAPTPAPPPEPTEIFNGVPVADIDAVEGEQLFYFIDVPANVSDFVVTTSGGTGDVDLRVRFGQLPTIADFDCGSFSFTNEEICEFTAPTSGEYFILVNAFEDSEGVTLEASWNDAPPAPETILENGVPVTLSGAAGDFLLFQFDIAEGETDLLVEIEPLAGATGDGDLYVRFGERPTLSDFDCRPFAFGNIEECGFTDPEVGTWYVGVRAFPTDGPLDNVALTASWLEAAGPSGLEVVTSGARMRPRHTLTWNGGEADVEVYRNGEVIYSGENTGTFTHTVPVFLGSSTYQVCDTGTEDCSSEVDAQ